MGKVMYRLWQVLWDICTIENWELGVRFVGDWERGFEGWGGPRVSRDIGCYLRLVSLGPAK